MKKTLILALGLSVGIFLLAKTNRSLASNQENWNDSVTHYFGLARVLNADSYLKLAECYHEGKGVEHNFPMVMAMLKGAETYGDGRATEKFFASLDEDDADRQTYEGLMRLEKSGIEDYDLVMAVARRGGELTEKMIQIAWMQRDGVTEEVASLLEKLAARVPVCYAKLGAYYKERDRRKAVEYYRLADQWACLDSTGATLLLEEYENEHEAHQLNQHEVKRLRLIKDGIGG